MIAALSVLSGRGDDEEIMSLKLCVLGSGSSGNCTYVASEQTAVLIDAGLSGRETAARMASVGAELVDLAGVCVTHEHADHKACLAVLHRRTGVGLYANAGTIEGIERAGKVPGLSWNVFTTGTPFEVGDMRIEPFSVPHDSYDPVGFIVGCGTLRVGVVTDMGMSTGLIRERLKGCRAAVIEANHDEALLRDCGRPWSLKQRISSRQGHLSNTQAADLACAVAGPELEVLFLAHLSAECNEPELAARTVRVALAKAGHAGVVVKLTYPDRPSDVVELVDAGP